MSLRRKCVLVINQTYESRSRVVVEVSSYWQFSGLLWQREQGSSPSHLVFFRRHTPHARRVRRLSFWCGCRSVFSFCSGCHSVFSGPAWTAGFDGLLLGMSIAVVRTNSGLGISIDHTLLSRPWLHTENITLGVGKWHGKEECSA